MSTLLEQASLVLIPSGYKEDTVYSVIPSNGSGDLSFTRASNGTRVNSAGLVEVCPWNLVGYSEDFSVGWTLIGGGSFTSNVATAPNGTTTADEYDQGGYVRQLFTIPSNYITFTFYVRAKTSSSSFRIGILGVGDSSIAQTVETVGTSWVQMIVTYDNFNQSAKGVFFSIQSGDTEVYIWGAQLNIGSTAKPYFPTTDRLNVPRLTYQNGGGGCPSLLLEKQSTNLLTYSEQFDNAVYTKRNSTIGSNVTTSPDGTSNADKIQEDTSNDRHDIYTGFACTNGVTYTQTIFAKQGERRYCFMSFGTAILNAGDSFFDLQDGVVVSTASGVTSSIENMGDGWYRCRITTTCSGDGTGYFVNGPANTSSNYIYQGVSGYGIYIYGAQIEASSYPTSYIPTTSSSATRVADACFKTGISSLIGQTEGTMFVQCNLQDSTGLGQAIATLYENSSNVIILYKQSDNVLKCFVVTGGTLVADLGVVAVSGNIKIAVGYKANDFALYINGVQRGTDTSGSVPTCSNLYLGADDGGAQKMSGTINQTILFPTRLTNAELTSITSL